MTTDKIDGDGLGDLTEDITSHYDKRLNKLATMRAAIESKQKIAGETYEQLSAKDKALADQVNRMRSELLSVISLLESFTELGEQISHMVSKTVTKASKAKELLH